MHKQMCMLIIVYMPSVGHSVALSQHLHVCYSHSLKLIICLYPRVGPEKSKDQPNSMFRMGAVI